METIGATVIFKTSLENLGVRYKYYLGDGDSKAYSAVVADKPYGDNFPIIKLEDT